MYELYFKGVYSPFKDDIEKLMNELIGVGLWYWGEVPGWSVRYKEEEEAVSDGSFTAYLTPNQVVKVLPKMLAGLAEFSVVEGKILPLIYDGNPRNRPCMTLNLNTLPKITKLVLAKHHYVYDLTFEPRFVRGYVPKIGKRTVEDKSFRGSYKQVTTVIVNAVEENQGQSVECAIVSRDRSATFEAKFYLGPRVEREVRKVTLELYKLLEILEEVEEGTRTLELGRLNFVWHGDRLLDEVKELPVVCTPNTVSIGFPGKRNPRFATFNRDSLEKAIGCARIAYHVPKKQDVWVRKEIGGWIVTSEKGYLKGRQGGLLSWGTYAQAVHFKEIVHAVKVLEACSPAKIPYKIFLEANLRDICRDQNGDLWQRTCALVVDRRVSPLPDPQRIAMPARLQDDGTYTNVFTANLSLYPPHVVFEFLVDAEEVF